jgi:hypothetical protein
MSRRLDGGSQERRCRLSRRPDLILMNSKADVRDLLVSVQEGPRRGYAAA